MDTSFLSVEKLFDGVHLIAKPLKGRLSKSEKKLNTIAAKAVQRWLNEPKNKSIILTLLCQLEVHGIAIGMSTVSDALSQAINYESYVNHATKSKLAAKTF